MQPTNTRPPRRRHTGGSLILRLMAGSLVVYGSCVLAQRDERPLADQPFHGLLVRDDAETGGLLVGWILPGPLNGAGFTSDVVNRGDLILAVNGRRMNREQFNEFLRGARPDDTMTLTVRHTGGDAGGAVPTAGGGTEEREHRITLASRAEWSGPVAHQSANGPPFDPQGVVPISGEKTSLEAFIRGRVEAHDLAEPIDKLLDYFRTTVEANNGANMLSRVRYGFHQPTRLAELHGLVTGGLDSIPGSPARLFAEAAANLDGAAPAPGEPVDLADPRRAVESAARMLRQSHAHLDAAFARLDPALRASLPATLIDITETVAQGLYIHGHPEAKRLIEGLRASLSVDFDALLAAGAALDGFLQPGAPAPADAPGIVVPEPLRQLVTGDILAFEALGEEWIVYGGAGSNSYDLARIAAVIDAGGDDEYRYGPVEGDPPADWPRAQLIVDSAGNDRYLGGQRGPAGALMGVSLIVDHAGNDTYQGASRACGVGVMGVGVILDRAGADTYSGTRWSIGAAFYGLGAIIDCGGDSDVYTAEMMSQGIGGPRGFGVIIDENGRDLYRVNGPTPSVYGTPAVYVGFSQGVGLGVRLYDTGGIGVISDLGGDDRYEGGEFCQGGAYYWGLGILHDRRGNDLYYGNRYGQAWAAHQALGILVDDGGDDTYWSMTAASQSGSWDICATLLLDRAGNDSYHADGLAQGGASQQAIAWFVDLEGIDRYIAPPGATQGQSGGNEYHFDETGCFSWSVFLDAGGSEDFYSTDRTNGAVLSTGQPDASAPHNSPLHGLFIDTKERERFFFE